MMKILKRVPFNEAVCVGCGCSDFNACMTHDGDCYWLKVNRKTGLGVCSECAEYINADIGTPQEGKKS